MDGRHLAAELPKGWEGHFELERGNSAADDFINALEQAWHGAGELQGSTLHQYVTETTAAVQDAAMSQALGITVFLFGFGTRPPRSRRP